MVPLEDAKRSIQHVQLCPLQGGEDRERKRLVFVTFEFTLDRRCRL